jgi:hypothetical protein
MINIVALETLLDEIFRKSLDVMNAMFQDKWSSKIDASNFNFIKGNSFGSIPIDGS